VIPWKVLLFLLLNLGSKHGVQSSFAACVKVESPEKDTILLSDSSDDEVIPRTKSQYSFLTPSLEIVLEVLESGSLSTMPSQS
jgi:hypothetical protein